MVFCEGINWHHLLIGNMLCEQRITFAQLSTWEGSRHKKEMKSVGRTGRKRNNW